LLQPLPGTPHESGDVQAFTEQPNRKSTKFGMRKENSAQPMLDDQGKAVPARLQS
jgi:hypothetical protein